MNILSLKTFSNDYNKNQLLDNDIVKYVIYFISLTLAIGYTVNNQILPLSFFIICSILVYFFNKKNIISALLLSIVATNLLIALNLFK
jgi:phosphate starvation-inducible membrane PsiE